MKLMIAIIKPFKLEDVHDALSTIDERAHDGRPRSRDMDDKKGHTEVYRGAEYAVNFLPKVRLEIAVAAADADSVDDAITASAKTRRISDGKILVAPIDRAMRIRTDQTDADAL